MCGQWSLIIIKAFHFGGQKAKTSPVVMPEFKKDGNILSILHSSLGLLAFISFPANENPVY